VSIQDRVLEAIATELKNVKDRFMQVKQDVSDISTALRNQNYGDIINVAQDNLIDDLENKEIVNGMSYKMLENTVSDIQGRLTSDERIQALQDVYSTVQDKQAALNELIRDQRYHDTVVEELDNALSQARKREVVDQTLQRFNQLTERAKNDIADTFLNFAGSATIDDKLSILQATEQQDVTRYITNLAEKNRRYNALAEDQDVPPRSLNELGLTDDETHTVFNEILRGDRGIPAQRALLRSSLDYMTPDQVGTVYDTIMNIDYDRIVDDVKQQTVENLPDDVKQRVWDETVGKFNDGQIADLHDHLSQDFKQRLYNHYYDQYRGVVEDAVKQGREQLFNAAQCAPNPFDNI
jgi:hypothetical protein